MNYDKSYFDDKLRKYNLTPTTFESCYQDVLAKVKGDIDMDWSDIISKYDLPLSKDTLRKASSQEVFGSVFVMEYFKSKNTTPCTQNQSIPKYKTESTINKDGTYTSDRLIDVAPTELKNKNSLLEAHGYDPRQWELVSAKNSVWNMYTKEKGIRDLYSSKVTVKPRTEISLFEIEDFYKELVDKYKSPEVLAYETRNDGFLFELPIMDLHLGKFSSRDIVDQEYNASIARDNFNYVIDSCIARLKGKPIEKILFPVGNDFLHIDNVKSTTTEGTPQDTDLQHQTLFKEGVLLLVDGITKLSRELKTQVEVFCVQGNHDFMSSYHLVMALWCYFHNNHNVNVSLDTSPRKYYEYGKNLIGFAHGDKEKKRIKTIMQIEAAESWGRTKFHEFHLAHLHSEHTSEDGGIVIRNLPSITGTDQWHHNSGYVGAIRKCTCFLWDKELGLDSTFNVVIND